MPTGRGSSPFLIRATPPGYVGRATPLLGMWGDNNIYGYSANTRQPKWIGDYMAVAKQLHTVDKSLAY